MFPSQWWLILAVALALNSVGFKKYVWFKTIGYGLSVGGMALAIGVMAIVRGRSSAGFMILCIALLIYGFRLAATLLLRERRSFLINGPLSAENYKHISLTATTILWLLDSILYCSLMAPVFYRLSDLTALGDEASLYIGMCVTISGVVIEIMADYQRTEQRKTNSSLPATEGLYSMCRCPDYFGEILVWTGVFITGVTVYTVSQFIFALIGYLIILYMMINGAKRMEIQQIKCFGKNKTYIEYANKTPILIPLVPLYHLVKVKNEE